MTDEALLTAYQRGDLSAFATLVARFERPLWAFLRRFVRNDAVAEDLLQETFLRVVGGASQWRPSAKVSTWLYTIARNLCTDHARRMSHRQATSLDGAATTGDEGSAPKLMDRLASSDGGGERAAMDRETAVRIEAAIDRLPAEQREVFLMREVLDLPFAEIAVAVGVSEPTVKSRMRYALERLRQGLSELRESAETPAVVGGAEQR